ncbi:carnitine acetyltransferase [Cryptococcus neoformans Bt85]|nr:carnitine acetyltransferase [Cryptococcus neoformans var. grubii Bt85]
MIIPSSIHRIQSVHTPLRTLRATSFFTVSAPTHPASITARNVSRRMFAASTYRSNQPKTFENQSKLPRLPVPDLEASLEGYLKSLEPLLEEKYDKASLSNEVEKRQLYVKDFASTGGLGRVLQERLKDLDHVSPNNWLNDTLWLALAYHTWRAPLLVNSNWWLCFAEDPLSPPPPSLPSSTKESNATRAQTATIKVPNPSPLTDVPAGGQGGGKEWLVSGSIDPPVQYEKVVKKEWITPWQIRRAAWIARRFAEFRTKLEREEIKPDEIKGVKFCMNQYANMFNLSRIPLPNCDAFSTPSPLSTHLSLLVDDYYYAIDIFSPPSSSVDGVPEPLPAGEIEKRFQAAVDDAKRRKERGERAVEVGVLGADDRDNWTKNREHLLLVSPSNRSTLTSLSTSLLALSLDPYTLPSVPPPSGDPLRLPAVDAQVRNCATGIDGGRNRWFDKAVSVLVETNGRAGIMGEHSPVDALIPSIVVEYVLDKPVDGSQFMSSAPVPVATGKSGEGWEKLDWAVDETILQEIEQIKQRNQKLIDDSDASQLWWGEYASEWIKKIAKQAPDAYIQQALQLAWFLDQGYPTATYETASTRTMLHGRTDVIRSLTSESRAFVKAMVNPESTAEERYRLLSSACQAHNALTKRSSSGHGYDRHLMGLKVQLRAGETHPLFEDEVYAKSQEWKLSTSGLSAGGKFTATGFGAAWPDGYGINYMAGPHLIKFGIESKFSCEKTSTQRFKHNIVQVLRDMRAVCEAVGGVDASRAKL